MEEKKSIFTHILGELRKKAIGLKRNFYVIPMIFIIIVFCQFMFKLYVISPAATYIYANINDLILNPTNYPGIDINQYRFECSVVNYYSLFVFLITLFSILYSVSFIFFMQNKDEKIKKWFFFGLYFFVTACVITLEIFLVKETNLAANLTKFNIEKLAAAGDSIAKYEETLALELKTSGNLLANIILNGISMVIVAISPLLQELCKKIKFKRISTNG